MVTRDDIKQFLIAQASNSKEEVLSNFSSWVITQGESVDKLAKLIKDIRSYKEWIWGE